MDLIRIEHGIYESYGPVLMGIDLDVFCCLDFEQSEIENTKVKIFKRRLNTCKQIKNQIVLIFFFNLKCCATCNYKAYVHSHKCPKQLFSS